MWFATVTTVVHMTIVIINNSHNMSSYCLSYWVLLIIVYYLTIITLCGLSNGWVDILRADS